MSAAAIVVTIALLGLALGLVAVERGRGGVKELALVAALGAAAAAGRVLFAAIPSVKPVSVVVLVAGATLGPRAGFATGALAALASNFVLGQGSWTPAQMLLWGLVGVSGAVLAPVVRRPLGLAAIGVVWGFLFGWGMNLWTLATLGPEVSWAAMVALSSTSIWFEVAHAVGNAVFALTIGPPLVRMLTRYSDRIETDFVVEGPGAVVPSRE
jgi:energy-coupling factor transport system substrate-specific component